MIPLYEVREQAKLIYGGGNSNSLPLVGEGVIDCNSLQQIIWSGGNCPILTVDVVYMGLCICQSIVFKIYVFHDFLKPFQCLFIFEKERERKQGRGRERRRHSIWSRLQAPSCQQGAQHGAQNHELWDHDLSQSQMLNQLGHPGAPIYFIYNLYPTYVCVYIYIISIMYIYNMYINICTHIYIYMCIYMYIYIYICVYINIYVYIYMYKLLYSKFYI